MAKDDARDIRLQKVAIETLCDARLHQSFKFVYRAAGSQTETTLRVTYSDLGYNSSARQRSESNLLSLVGNGRISPDGDYAEPAVVLFIGGLMGGRYTLGRSHGIAKRLRLRMITMDRPGMGGSTPVPLKDRLAVHLAAVPALLARLGIKHVALASHSGGAPYLLQTILTHRHILHPSRPHVVMLSPWVCPEDSRVITMQMAASLPNWALGRFHALASGFNVSMRLSSGVLPKFGSASKTETDASLDDVVIEIESGRWQGKTPGFEEFVKIVENLAMKYVFAEGVTGASEDLLLYMRKAVAEVIPTNLSTSRRRKSKTGHSGTAVDVSSDPEIVDWLDYRGCVAVIGRQERDSHHNPSAGTAEAAHTIEASDTEPRSPLKVDVFHAEKDDLVGRRGAAFFDSCWTDHDEPIVADPSVPSHSSSEPESRSDAQFQPYIFAAQRCEGTNHDSVMDPSKGVMELWLQRVADRWYGK